MFLVVSGEFLLDTGIFDYDGKIQPFLFSQQECCFPLSSGSILGDEGVTGETHSFESTAVVVSDAAVVFEAIGFGLTFLSEKIQALRYCALSYKDRSKWSAPIAYAEELNPYTYFNSLRKCIAYIHPYRGSLANIYSDVKNKTHFVKPSEHNTETQVTKATSNAAITEETKTNTNGTNNNNNKPPTASTAHIATHGHRNSMTRSSSISHHHRSPSSAHIKPLSSHSSSNLHPHTPNTANNNTTSNNNNNTNNSAAKPKQTGKKAVPGAPQISLVMSNKLSPEQEQAAAETRGVLG